MAEKIVLETEIKTGNSGASIKSVKRELAELKSLMATLDMDSQAFTDAAKKAAQLKDQINDANDALRNFDPGAKFTAVTTVLGGVANGFSAAQGAMALFGSESEDLEKVMVRTQGAIALATGLNGLQGMWGQLTIVANVIKTQVVAAFATMRAAIMSTGIIALVAVIGTLIYSWMQEKEANEEATKELKRFGEENKRIQDEVTKTAIAGMKGRQKEQTELQARYNKQIADLYADETKSIREKNAVALELNKQLEIEQQALKDKYREEDLKKQKEYDDKLKERLKANQKSNDEYAKIADEKFKADMYAQIEAEKELSRLTEEFSRKEFEDSMKRYDAEQAAIKYSMELDRLRTETKLAELSAVSNALSSFEQLVGSQTAAGKALAVAQTTIDTYVAAFRAYKEGFKIDPTGTLSIINATAATIAGIASVKKIMSVQTPGGGGGGSVPSAPNMSIPRMAATGNEVSGAGAISLSSQPNNKVYVVESDIRRVQNKVEVIENNARIG